MTQPLRAGHAAISWHGERLVMMPERALHWEQRDTLIMTDPHFGKAAAFRAYGVPVPSGTTAANLERLDAALHASRAGRLLVLGDFFHAAAGRAPDTLARIATWRAARASLEIVLVPGNHDIAAGMPPLEWGIRCVRGELFDSPFRFRHQPGAVDDARPCFAGHVHPAVLLEDAGGARLRAPAFLFGERLALLPAFGGFTGGARVAPRDGDRVFAVGNDEIVEVRGVLRGRRGGRET